MYKKTALIIALLAMGFGVAAQRKPVAAADTSRWDLHLSAGATVATGWGKTDALSWVAPSVECRLSDRLTVVGGFAAVGSLFDSYELQPAGQRSLAPRRHGTRVVSGRVAAEYRASDRLTLWGSVAKTGGWYEPLWTPRGEALDLDVTEFSGGMELVLGTDALLQMHFHIVHDHYGNSALGLLGHPWYGCGVPSMDLYDGPLF